MLVSWIINHLYAANHLLLNNIIKQECIPVGCVPPAHWSYLCISLYPMHIPPKQPHTPPRSNHACSLGATTHIPREQPHTPWEQLCTPCPLEQPHTPPGATMHAPQEQPCIPPPRSNLAPPGATMNTPPVNRMTNRCKNITLPQTSFAGGNNEYDYGQEDAMTVSTSDGQIAIDALGVFQLVSRGLSCILQLNYRWNAGMSPLTQSSLRTADK